MINKYEAYWLWEKNPDGAYKFRCTAKKHLLWCCDCPFNNTVLCSPITNNVPIWNKVRKIMQEVYGV